MTEQRWMRKYDRFEDMTRLASAMVPLKQSGTGAEHEMLLAFRLDAAGDRSAPYVDASGSSFRPQDELMVRLEALGGLARRYDHLYATILSLGKERFGREEPCFFLLDSRERLTLAPKQRAFHQSGLRGQPTETMIYEIDPRLIERLDRASVVEGRIGVVEFTLDTSGRNILSDYRAQLFGC